MANTWFDSDFYLSSKLAQLQKTEPNNAKWQGPAALANLNDALKVAGYTPESHFLTFGSAELTSPNKYFNAEEYLAAKAVQSNAAKVDGKTDWTAVTIALAINQAGMSIYEHFKNFGWKEGVNPSNAFDVAKYFDSKLAQLVKDEPAADWTLEKVKAAFEAANLDPVDHAVQFAAKEGVAITASTTPVAPTTGNTYALTVGVDSFTGTAANDTFNANPGASNANTFSALDVIDGGAGIDTLNVVEIGAASVNNYVLNAAATVKNVEVLNYTVAGDDVGDTVTAGVGAWTGLEKVNVAVTGTAAAVTINTNANVTEASVKGAAAVTISDAATATADKLATLSVVDATGLVTVNSAKFTTLNLSSTATGTSTGGATINAAAGTRELNLNLNKVTGGTIADAEATSLKIDATGANSSGITLSTAKAAAIAISGDKTLSLDLGVAASQAANLAVTVTNTAGVTLAGNALDTDVTFTGGAGKDSVKVGATTKTIDMGAGDDSIEVGGALGTNGKLAGGEGSDTLKMTAAIAQTLSATDVFAKSIEGFEKVSVGKVAATTTNTVKLSNLKDINYVVSEGTGAAGTNASQAFTLATDLVAGQSVTIGGMTLTATGAVTAAQAASAFASGSVAGVAATVTGSVGSGWTGTATAGSVTFVNSTVGATLTGSVAAAAAPAVPSKSTTNGSGTTAETSAVTFTALTAGQSVTVGGKTLTATQSLTADQVAAAFVAVTPVGATASGSLTGWTASTATGSAVTFTAVYTEPTALAATGVTFAKTGTAGAGAVITNTATLANVADGAPVTMAGLTFTAATGATLTAAAIGAYLKDGTAIPAAEGTVTGTKTAGWDSADSSATQAIFKYTIAANVADLAVSTAAGTAPTLTTGAASAGTAGSELVISEMANSGTFELTDTVAGKVTVSLKDSTSTADVLNIKLNGTSNIVNTGSVVVAGVETINIEATDRSADTPTLANPSAASTIRLDAAAATKIVVTGNHGVDFTGSTLTNVVELDATGVVSVGNAASSNAAQIATTGAVKFTSVVTNKAVTVKTGNGADTIDLASVTDATKGASVSTGEGGDTITGTAGNDTIDAGAGRDVVYATAGADTITLGAGNDVYGLANASFSVLSKMDTITDFSANTKGQGTTVALVSKGATGTTADLTGDTINVTGLFAGGVDGIKVLVVSNAADAQTFIQNTANVTTGVEANFTGFALDSSSNQLYLDFNQDGAVDSVIKLTGVTTITEAAFVTSL